LPRNRVHRPRTPRSVGEVTAEIWRRGPFSSSYGGSISVTQKYWPGRYSTSCPWRSKMTSSVSFATSRFSLTSACIGSYVHAGPCVLRETSGTEPAQTASGGDRTIEAMAKAAALQHACSECGYTTGRWLGRCPGCGSFGTLVEERLSAPAGAAPARP